MRFRRKGLNPHRAVFLAQTRDILEEGGTLFHCLIVFTDKTFQPALHFALKDSATSVRWEYRLKGDVWNKDCTMLLPLCLGHRDSLKFDSHGLSLQMTCLSFWVSRGHFLNTVSRNKLMLPLLPRTASPDLSIKLLQSPSSYKIPQKPTSKATFLNFWGLYSFVLSVASFTPLYARLLQGLEKFASHKKHKLWHKCYWCIARAAVKTPWLAACLLPLPTLWHSIFFPGGMRFFAEYE